MNLTYLDLIILVTALIWVLITGYHHLKHKK